MFQDHVEHHENHTSLLKGQVVPSPKAHISWVTWTRSPHHNSDRCHTLYSAYCSSPGFSSTALSKAALRSVSGR